MNTITETDLISAIKYNAVEILKIVQTEGERYRISVKLRNDKEEKSLLTTRKDPREWVSLDRLQKHIRKTYGAVPISLTLLFDPLE